MTTSEYRSILGNRDNHVILGYCFGRNDVELRGQTGLGPATSYVDEETFFGVHNIWPSEVQWENLPIF
jgi:Toxin with a H, D/N and C signature